MTCFLQNNLFSSIRTHRLREYLQILLSVLKHLEGVKYYLSQKSPVLHFFFLLENNAKWELSSPHHLSFSALTIVLHIAPLLSLTYATVQYSLQNMWLVYVVSESCCHLSFYRVKILELIHYLLNWTFCHYFNLDDIGFYCYCFGTF